MEHPKNLIIVIFGASGDLASRKLIPAIYSLSCQNMMPEKYAILGVGRSKIEPEQFRIKMKEAILSFSEEKIDETSQLTAFTENLFYVSMDDYAAKDEIAWPVATSLKDIEGKYGIDGNYVFYMATPPSLYEIIAHSIAKSGLSIQDDGFRRFM